MNQPAICSPILCDAYQVWLNASQAVIIEQFKGVDWLHQSTRLNCSIMTALLHFAQH